MYAYMSLFIPVGIPVTVGPSGQVPKASNTPSWPQARGWTRATGGTRVFHREGAGPPPPGLARLTSVEVTGRRRRSWASDGWHIFILHVSPSETFLRPIVN